MHVPLPFTSPWTLSTRLVSETATLPVLVTLTANETSPPGSGTDVGVAVLVTEMVGVERILNVAVAVLSAGSGSVV